MIGYALNRLSSLLFVLLISLCSTHSFAQLSGGTESSGGADVGGPKIYSSDSGGGDEDDGTTSGGADVGGSNGLLDYFSNISNSAYLVLQTVNSDEVTDAEISNFSKSLGLDIEEELTRIKINHYNLEKRESLLKVLGSERNLFRLADQSSLQKYYTQSRKKTLWMVTEIDRIGSPIYVDEALRPGDFSNLTSTVMVIHELLHQLGAKDISIEAFDIQEQKETLDLFAALLIKIAQNKDRFLFLEDGEIYRQAINYCSIGIDSFFSQNASNIYVGLLGTLTDGMKNRCIAELQRYGDTPELPTYYRIAKLIDATCDLGTIYREQEEQFGIKLFGTCQNWSFQQFNSPSIEMDQNFGPLNWMKSLQW